MSEPARRAQDPTEKQLVALRASLREFHRPANADRPPARFLRELLGKHPSPGAALAQFMAYEPDERVREAATICLFVAAKDPSVPPAVSKTLLESASFTLLRALRDPTVPDARKYELGPLLACSGHGLATDEYRACFQDFDAIATKRARDRMAAMSDSLEASERTLTSMELVDHGGQTAPTAAVCRRAFAMLSDVAEHNPPAAATLLPVAAAIAHEHGLVPDLAVHALELAAKLQSPRAAWFLAELGRWPAAGPLGERAKLLAADLATAGVASKAPVTPAFSHGAVTGNDGAGSRSVMLFFKRGDGALDALSLLLNDLVGVKDVWPVFGEGADVEDGLRGLALPFASCDLAFARALVADAFAKHAAIGRTLPGRLLLYRALLGDEPIVPAARKPDLGAYLLETVARGPSLVEGSDELLGHPLYGDVWFCGDDAYAFVRALPKKRGRRSAKAQAQLVDDFIRTVATKERELLALRMATNLEVDARGGRAKKPINQRAAHVWLALTEGVVPLEEIPYVRALSERALDAIKKNLSMGYQSQREANEVGHAMEAEASRLFSGLLDQDL